MGMDRRCVSCNVSCNTYFNFLLCLLLRLHSANICYVSVRYDPSLSSASLLVNFFFSSDRF